MGKEIVIGLFTAFLAGGLATSWKSFVVPYLIENFGERIKIHHKWASDLNFGSGYLHGIKLTLNKLGYNITGELEFTTGRHAGKQYYIKGRFQSNILTFHYYPHDKHSTSQGTATFIRLMDGELLSGNFAYFSQEKSLVDSVKCELTPLK